MRSRATVSYVSEHVYCSSTGHYAADVTITRSGRDGYYVYDFDGTLLQRGKRDWLETPYPKYLEAAILEKLRDIYIRGIVRVYEHDRDENRRYENLRYHIRKHFEHLIGLQPASPAFKWCDCASERDADSGFCEHCADGK